MAEGGIHFPTVSLNMEIKGNQSEPVTPAGQSKKRPGVGEDTTERGSPKCFIFMFSTCSTVCLLCSVSLLPGLPRKLALAMDVQPAVGGLGVCSLPARSSQWETWE